MKGQNIKGEIGIFPRNYVTLQRVGGSLDGIMHDIEKWTVEEGDQQESPIPMQVNKPIDTWTKEDVCEWLSSTYHLPEQTLQQFQGTFQVY
jgi:hypothetical protein